MFDEAFATLKPLKVAPSFASVFVFGGPAVIEPTGVLAIDGKCEITFYKPMPLATSVNHARVRGVYDKGKEKGAIIQNELTVSEWRA
ncbi:hypothetical protein [Bradyrhizobium sp. CCBAU 45394]|uniref:hypothetical protein n=1 Tax=Bradyrhizobium sp. CCBAU 45394 TaxID=1325087 RepID=UPI0023026FD8|nr:hypothetical protein [Bradyrhizobium sp. CCBAU 45394]